MTDYAEYCQVKTITGLDLTSAQCLPFMMAANAIIDKAAASGCTASFEMKIQAANFLTAHLLALSKPGESAAPTESERFENWAITRKTGDNSGEGILSTNYGRTANMLMGGCLVGMDKRTARVDFL